MTLDVRITTVPAASTHDLRRSVLRDGDPDADVAWSGDDDPTTVHLAAMSGDEVVAVSTWLERRAPGSEARAVQLRGMATRPDLAGSGLGTRMIEAGLAHARSIGAELVWANARVTALDFYLANDFDVEGPIFETPDTGLAHRRIVRLSPF